eukprot:gene11564-21798_t
MNPNQPVMLPPYGSYDGVSGILVIPLKKTNEIAVQTDESCMSPDYVPYQPPQRTADEAVQDVNSADEQGTNPDNLTCTVCHKEFADVRKLRQHFDANHSKESLRCKDCGQVFLTAKNMQMHKVRVHNKRMPFRCGVCSLRFEDRTSVVQHLATHNASESTFRCDTCGKRFGSEEKLRKHEQKHREMWHKCIECNRTFGSEVTLAYHVEQVHKRQQQAIDVSVTEAASNQVSQRESADHSVDDDLIYDEDEAENANEVSQTAEELSCQFCSSKFVSSKKLENHVRNCEMSSFGKGMKKMFRCAVCHTFFALKSQLVNHYNTMHLTRDGYSCSKCPRKFRLWSRLKLHIKAFHHSRRSSVTKNVCSVCSERFLSRNKLEDHLRDVHQIQPYQSKVGRIYTCKECKKRFTNLSSLMVHRRGVHSLNILESPSTQTWKCQYCDIERLTKKTYIAHLKEVHDMSVIEKGRSLEIVDKEFTSSVVTAEPDSRRSSESQALHAADDENSTKDTSDVWHCSECDAEYFDEKSYKNHLGLVHGKKPFLCTTCGKRFAYSGQATWHMREHENEAGNSQTQTSISVSSNVADNEVVVSPEEDGIITVEPGLPPHTCVHCNTTYQNEKRLNNHLGMRHGYKNFQCDVCNQKFAYSTHLIWHRRSHFPDKKKESNARSQDLENIDSVPKDYEVNIETGNAVDPDMQSSIDESHYDAAEEVVANGYSQRSRFVCSQCGAEFVEQEQFREHMIVVHDAAVGKSNTIEAESSFNQLEAGEELQDGGCYTCEVCNKQLSTHIGWKVHRTRVHKLTDDKPLASSPGSIKKAFMSNPLSVHGGSAGAGLIHQEVSAQTLTPKKNELGSEDLSPNAVYSCSKCSRVFTGLRSLRTHQFKLHAIRVKDTHHRSQPTASGDRNLFSKVRSGEIFQCGTCDYQFSTEKGRRIHCKKMRHAEFRTSMWTSNQLPPTSQVSKDANEVFEPDNFPSNPKRQRVDDDTENCVAPCEFCDAKLQNLEALKIHFQNKHPDMISLQDSPFKSPSDVVPRASESDNSFQQLDLPSMIDCPRCDRSFPSRKAINAHMVKFHKVKGAALVRTLKEGRRPEQRPTMINDRLDNSQYVTGSEEISVADTESNPKAFRICPVCRRAFHNRRGLTMHLVRYHHMNKIGIKKLNLGSRYDDDFPVVSDSTTANKCTIPGRKSTGLKEFCPLCPMTFPNRRSLGTHIFKRHGIRCKQLSPAERRSLFSAGRYEGEVEERQIAREVLVATDCPICGGKFVGKRGLRAHVSRIHGLDKIELGFMFPINNPTDDDGIMKCQDCPREFNNKRIFAAHLYFVHKKDSVDAYTASLEGGSQPDSADAAKTEEAFAKEDSNANEKNEGSLQGAEHHQTNTIEASPNDAVTCVPDNSEKGQSDLPDESSRAMTSSTPEKMTYNCINPTCGETFKTPLELLVHVRKENGRSLSDVDKEVKNVNAEDIVEGQDEEFDYDDLENDDIDDEIMSEEREVIERDPFEEEDNFPNIHALETDGKFVCSLCKSEFDDQKAFKIHYKKTHCKGSHGDAGRLRDVVERSLLQTEAVSKEYSLRATASRKAFRSEIELTEQILSGPATPEESEQEEESLSIDEVVAHEEERIQSGSSTFPPVRKDVDAEKIQSDVALGSSLSETRPSEGKSVDESPILDSKDKEDEPAKKSAFAAALNLQVMT